MYPEVWLSETGAHVLPWIDEHLSVQVSFGDCHSCSRNRCCDAADGVKYNKYVRERETVQSAGTP